MQNSRCPGYTFPMQSGVWVAAVEAFLLVGVCGGLSPGTNRLREHYLRRLAAVCPDPWAVTRTDLVAFLSSPDWSPETRKSARGAVRAFYGWAVTEGHMPHNPAAGLPPVKIPRTVPHPTPEDRLEYAITHASDRDRMMIMLAAYAGLRRAEIAGLRLVDVAGGVVRVRGKGGRERVVPVHPRLEPVIVQELERRRLGILGSGHRYGDATSPYLFPGQGSGPITPGAVGKILARLTGAPGHWLRHRFATRAYAGTKDLRAVQELLGHSRPETTAIYTLVPDDALRAAVNAA